MIGHKFSIALSTLCILSGCGYTILKEDDVNRQSGNTPTLQANKNKIGGLLATTLRNYEQTRADTMSMKNPYEPFLFHEFSGVDDFGRVRLRLRTDYTGNDVLDSLAAVNARVENAIRQPDGRGRYIIWLKPELVERVTMWPRTTDIDIMIRTGGTRQGN